MPPRLLESPLPEPPPAYAERGEEPIVLLRVVVLPDGSVGAVETHPETAPDLVAPAVDAVRRWRFAPARRGGQPIAARIALELRFRLPDMGRLVVTARGSPGPSSSDRSTREATPSETSDDEARGAVPDASAPEREDPAPPHDTGDTDDADDEPVFAAHAVAQHGPMESGPRGAADYALAADELPAATSHDAGELLRAAPGVFVARPEGDAVGHRIMLRGFDAEHGQDIELRVAGVPVNEPSHLHGQGYADLGFVIPELVSGMRVTAGVYDPSQGDFAVAGSIAMELGVRDRGARVQLDAGSFRTFRALALIAPEDLDEDTFGAVTIRTSDGFGEQRGSRAATAMAQLGFDVGSFRFRLLGNAHATRAGLAGVVREDDVAAGRVGFYEAYDLATAEAQSATSLRAGLSLHGMHSGRDGGRTELLTFFTFRDFRLQENFTGFTQRSELDPSWVGRGDLIEQQNRSIDIGLNFRHRTRRFQPFAWLATHLAMGASGRLTRIGQNQNLIEAPLNRTWDRRVDADILAVDVGVYGDLGLELVERVDIHAGVRADLLAYTIADALANTTPMFRPDTFVPGYRRSASGVAVGPRVSVAADLGRGLELRAAYGEGFRSPQARTLEDGENAPFTKVRSADLGVHYCALDSRLEVGLATFLTRLEDDVAFEAREGRLEPIPGTQRLGGTLRAVARPWLWLTSTATLTYVRATLQDDPPRSIRDPEPALAEGDRLPFVPPWVFRFDTRVDRRLGQVRGSDLRLRAGVGVGAISARPLPFGTQTPAFALVDASVQVSWMHMTLGVRAENLTGTRYAASAYHFASTWEPDAVPTRVPVTHTAAGAPRSILVTLGGSL